PFHVFPCTDGRSIIVCRLLAKVPAATKEAMPRLTTISEETIGTAVRPPPRSSARRAPATAGAGAPVLDRSDAMADGRAGARSLEPSALDACQAGQVASNVASAATPR